MHSGSDKMHQQSTQQLSNEKALTETQTLRALAVVRFGHRPPARNKHTNTQTHKQDRLQYTAPLANAQCKNNATKVGAHTHTISFRHLNEQKEAIFMTLSGPVYNSISGRLRGRKIQT